MKLNNIYKLLPDITCKKNCTACCSPVYMLKSEAAKIGLKDRLHTNWDKNYDCEYKTSTGCTIYDKRPFICRLFGCAETGLFSCNRTSGNFISHENTMNILGFYHEISIKSNTIHSEEVVKAMHYHDQLMNLRGTSLPRLKPGEKITKYTSDIIQKVEFKNDTDMNEILSKQGKEIIKELLKNCTNDQIHFFKRMYSHHNIELPISEVVDNISDNKIEYAISQCERTVKNNKSKVDNEKNV